ncbi:MAG: hypothetical protein ACRD68_03115, partial [Pyrinomonadaceae bacterium]
EQDSFDVPYRIHEGSYYRVPGVAGGREGRPAIMWLRDYNGDGKASEFVLFDAQACTGLQTTLVGYSASQDKVIQYPVELQVINGDNRAIEVRQWVDYLFSKTPAGPGRWKYEIDYRGRGGTLDRYEVRYDRRAEKFVGKAEELGDEPGARPED